MLKVNSFTVGNIDSNEDVTVFLQEIYDAIMMLNDNNACHMDGAFKTCE